MRIYIIGTGGVGGYFGGLLAKAGYDVAFLVRREHYTRVKEYGLVVKSVIENFCIKQVNLIKDISEIRNPDLIIFTVKTYDTDELANQLSNVVNEKTIIITFQNGIDNDIRIKKHIKNVHVYPGVAYIVSTKTSEGVIEQTSGERKLIFGDRDNRNNKKLIEIEKIMKNSGINAVCSHDIISDIWNKFIFISAYSGMTAICRATIGMVLENPITLELYKRCLSETITIANMLNINLQDNPMDVCMSATMKISYNSKSSLLVDIERGRKTEIETLNGTVVRIANELNIDVPINTLIYGAVKLTEPDTQ